MMTYDKNCSCESCYTDRIQNCLWPKLRESKKPGLEENSEQIGETQGVGRGSFFNIAKHVIRFNVCPRSMFVFRGVPLFEEFPGLPGKGC